MLNLKKVIASICVLAMVLSTVAFGATYTDVTEESVYYEAVETLTKLGIVEGFDGEYRPEDGVTRAEMAALIARIQGYGETAKGAANTAFTDVPSSHWASGYIANAAGMGIINGYGDGTFGPEDPVLYEQAVKMVMATLGYTPFAEQNGGYPTGYIAAAQRYDVSLAVANAAVGQEANRGTVAQLLVNALDTPLMIQSQWNTNGEVTYVIADGKTQGGIRADYKTLMSENLGYVKIRGIVEDSGLVTITSTGDKMFDKTEEPAVAIDVVDAYKTDNTDFDTLGTKKFLAGETEVADYLGRSVIGYVRELSNEEYELVSVALDTNRNDELVINLSDYSSINSDNTISYYREGASKTTEVGIAADMKVVLNNECIANAYYNAAGVLSGTTAKTALDGAGLNVNQGGAITLIDNDDVKGYDVAIVEVAATGVVKKATSEGINFKNSVALIGGSTKSIEIDEDDENQVVAIYKDGEIIDAATLQEWDILSIYAIDDESNVIVAEVIGTQIIGTVSSSKNSTTSSVSTAYRVDGNWYDVAAGAYGSGDLDVSEGGTFYIDEFGKIAAFVEDAALAGGLTANYAYVMGIDAAPADFGATGIDVKLQLVTAEGVVIVPVKNNAKAKLSDGSTAVLDLDGWSDDSGDDKFTSADTDWAAYNPIRTAVMSQVISYVKNSAGYITEIVCADYDTDKFATKTIASSAKYDAENSKFVAAAGTRYVDTDAILFVIKAGDAAESYVGSLADLETDETYTINAAYADKKADSINILVVDQTTVGAAGSTANLAVLKSVGTAESKDGEAVYELTYWLNGVEATAETTADVKSNVSGLTEGDIIKVKVGTGGIITDVQVVWNFSSAIRTINTEAIASTDFSTSNPTDEKFFGGVVTNFVEKTTEATVITGQEVRLDKADNVYVIDVWGKDLVVEDGTDGDFKFFCEELYTAANVNLSTDDGATYASTAVATAQTYTDYIYVRTYEDKPSDIIIVKGNPDVKIR